MSQCEARINVEREIKRFVRPFGKVINDISSSVDKAIFRPQKRYNYVKANSLLQFNVARGRLGHTTLAAALPHRIALNRRIMVYYPPTGRVIRLQVKDIGPWNTRDRYWTENRKPLAEVEETNSIGIPIDKSSRAGISLSPQAWYKLELDEISHLEVSSPAQLDGGLSMQIDLRRWKFTPRKRHYASGLVTKISSHPA